jgi:hypothetical protein
MAYFDVGNGLGPAPDALQPVLNVVFAHPLRPFAQGIHSQFFRIRLDPATSQRTSGLVS